MRLAEVAHIHTGYCKIATCYPSRPDKRAQRVAFSSNCERSELHVRVGWRNSLVYIYIRRKKHFKNEQRSKDAAAKKRPNTSGVGKINNYYEDIYLPPNNNTD